MCVILHGLKKRHMRRREIEEAMKSNPDGFCMFALRPNGTRDSIRTLDKDELLKFFDEKVGEEDAVCMHARIPSRGMDKTVANVHGWEEDGVVFMHNMTITAVDEFMKEDKWEGTDSEYFFRKIFMPAFRKFGDDAYKNGALDPWLDKLVRTYAGYSNKFLFIMPDNGVLRYGTWVNEADRKEGDEIAFWASNTSYRVYERAWPSASPSTGYSPSAVADDPYDYSSVYGRDEYDDEWYERRYRPAGKYKSEPKSTLEPLTYDGSYLREHVGDAFVAYIGVLLHVLSMAADERRMALRELGLGKDALDQAIEGIDNLLEGVCDTLLMECADICEGTSAVNKVEPGSPEQIETWLDGWASILEESLEKDGHLATSKFFHKAAFTLKKDAANLATAAQAALAALDCYIDISKEDLDEAIRAYVPAISRKGRLTTAKVRLTDLVTPPDMTEEGAFAAMKAALAFIRKGLK